MKIFAKLLKNSLGMTMTEMVVGGGVAAAAAMGAASLMGGMSGSTRDAELIIEKTQFASALGVYLNSSAGCGDLKTTLSGLTETPQDLSLQTWKYRGVPIWKNETLFSEKFKKDLFLKTLTGKLEIAPAAMQQVSINEEKLFKNLLRIRAVIEMNKRDFPHEYVLPVLLTEANAVRFCGSDMSMAETCGTLGGKFDEATSECKLAETCQVQGSFTRLSCAPHVGSPPYCDESKGVPFPGIPNPVNGQFTCPGESLPVSTGGEIWTQSRSCGKKCTLDVSNQIGFFTCMHCPN